MIADDTIVSTLHYVTLRTVANVPLTSAAATESTEHVTVAQHFFHVAVVVRLRLTCVSKFDRFSVFFYILLVLLFVTRRSASRANSTVLNVAAANDDMHR